MGSAGTIASRYCVNVQSLEEFDRALSLLSSRKELSNVEGSADAISTLLGILNPIKQSMSRKLSTAKNLDDYEVVRILHQRHAWNWQDYFSQILDLIGRLELSDINLTSGDVSILNDVADALDVRCGHLMNRMSGY